jgi:V/A-type H+-transporting ATPase subunit K
LEEKYMKKMRKAAIFAMLLTGFLIFGSIVALAADEVDVTAEENQQNKTMLILGCALAIGIAGIGSAIGLALAGSSAVAVTAEKPELFSKCLILQVLPMTQSVYGLLTAILLMMGAGLLGGGDVSITPLMGMGAVWIGLAVGLTGTSAINQGMVASSSISAVGRNPDVASKGIIFTVMPETIAIFGLLVGILLMVGLGLL